MRRGQPAHTVYAVSPADHCSAVQTPRTATRSSSQPRYQRLLPTTLVLTHTQTDLAETYAHTHTHRRTSGRVLLTSLVVVTITHTQRRIQMIELGLAVGWVG